MSYGAYWISAGDNVTLRDGTLATVEGINTKGNDIIYELRVPKKNSWEDEIISVSRNDIVEKVTKRGSQEDVGGDSIADVYKRRNIRPRDKRMRKKQGSEHEEAPNYRTWQYPRRDANGVRDNNINSSDSEEGANLNSPRRSYYSQHDMSDDDDDDRRPLLAPIREQLHIRRRNSSSSSRSERDQNHTRDEVQMSENNQHPKRMEQRPDEEGEPTWYQPYRRKTHVPRGHPESHSSLTFSDSDKSGFEKYIYWSGSRGHYHGNLPSTVIVLICLLVFYFVVLAAMVTTVTHMAISIFVVSYETDDTVGWFYTIGIIIELHFLITTLFASILAAFATLFMLSWANRFDVSQRKNHIDMCLQSVRRGTLVRIAFDLAFFITFFVMVARGKLSALEAFFIVCFYFGMGLSVIYVVVFSIIKVVIFTKDNWKDQNALEIICRHGRSKIEKRMSNRIEPKNGFCVYYCIISKLILSPLFIGLGFALAGVSIGPLIFGILVPYIAWGINMVRLWHYRETKIIQKQMTTTNFDNFGGKPTSNVQTIFCCYFVGVLFCVNLILLVITFLIQEPTADIQPAGYSEEWLPVCQYNLDDLSVADLALIDVASYETEDDAAVIIDEYFAKQWMMESWNDIFFELRPSAAHLRNTTVIAAVWGLQDFVPIMKRLNLWTEIMVLQMCSIVPLTYVWPLELLRNYVDIVRKILKPLIPVEEFENLDAAKARVSNISDVETSVFTGHAVSGGVAGLLGAGTDMISVLFSAPGIAVSSRNSGISKNDVHDIANIYSQKDIYPKVDKQTGAQFVLACDHSIDECSSIGRTFCELIGSCEDSKNLVRNLALAECYCANRNSNPEYIWTSCIASNYTIQSILAEIFSNVDLRDFYITGEQTFFSWLAEELKRTETSVIEGEVETMDIRRRTMEYRYLAEFILVPQTIEGAENLLSMIQDTDVLSSVIMDELTGLVSPNTNISLSLFLGTSSPTHSPTFFTLAPTVSPFTGSPTELPTSQPTGVPSEFVPTNLPTQNPTYQPTQNPTASPTVIPSNIPTVNPSIAPTLTPTVTPTNIPTEAPTENPTSSPTEFPTSSLSLAPTLSPTIFPTLLPTASSTESPTSSPSLSPTLSPTIFPTLLPTTSPTEFPTSSPSLAPTLPPTISPTLLPTASPTLIPTFSPTIPPSQLPTTIPTETPTELATSNVTNSTL